MWTLDTGPLPPWRRLSKAEQESPWHPAMSARPAGLAWSGHQACLLLKAPHICGLTMRWISQHQGLPQQKLFSGVAEEHVWIGKRLFCPCSQLEKDWSIPGSLERKDKENLRRGRTTDRTIWKHKQRLHPIAILQTCPHEPCSPPAPGLCPYLPVAP